MTEPNNRFNPEVHAVVARVGRVSAGWARFEYLLNEIIWHLANVEFDAGACITSQIVSPSNRMRAVISLARLRGGDDRLIADLNKFSVKADGIARERNRIVHDPWLVSSDGIARRVEVSADKRLKYVAMPISTEDMDKLSQKIADAIEEVETLHNRLKRELPSWPDRQYEQSLDRHPLRELLNPDSEK